MLIPSGPKDHLFIVCNDTCRLGANLLVNISSFYAGCDDTCVLDVGDHDFISHPSYVFYAEAMIKTSASLKAGFDREILIPQPDLAEHVFTKVEAGILKSPDSPLNIVRYFSQL